MIIKHNVSVMTVKEVLEKLEKFNALTFNGLEDYRMGCYFAVTYDEIMHNYQSEKNCFRLLIKTILRCFLRDYKYDFTKETHGKILLFYSHEHARRKDYVNFMSDVSRLLDDSYLFTGKDTSFKIKIGRTSWGNLLKLVGWYKQICKIETNTINKVYLLSKVSLAYRWKKEIENNWSILKEIRGLVTIFDAREYENILTQFLKINGKRTATLQHGFFPVISEQRGYLAIAATGLVSDEYWAWGEFSCENAVLSGLPSNICKPVGYPKSFKKRSGDIVDTQIMGIVLDGGESLLPYNKIIISIALEVAKKSNLKIVLKPHPNDKYDYVALLGDYRNYEISHETIFVFGNKVDFSLCYASSAYIDLMAMGALIFRYRKDGIENCYSRLANVDTFCDADELSALLLRKNAHVNDENRDALLGDLSKVKQGYNNAAIKLFGQ